MNTFKTLFLSLMFTASILLSACGAGEEDKTAPANVTPTKISGVWAINEKSDVRDCGNTAIKTNDYPATVTQGGDKITVVTPAGTFWGSVNGTTVSWTGEYFNTEENVWATITSMSLTFNANKLSGTSTWAFRDTQAGVVICEGATQMTGTLNPEGGESPTVPAAPSSLSGSTIAESAVRMNWSDNADNESSYKVERSQEEFDGFTQIASLGVNATAYVASGLSPSTRYFFRVRASNSIGDSAYSNTINVVTTAPTITIPAAPTQLSAIAVENSITLNWTDNAANESFYKIERRQENNTFGFTEIASLGIDSRRYVDTNLTRGARYYYRIRATNSAGPSDVYSNTASALIGVRRMDPPVLSLSKTNTGRLFLQWTHILGVLPKREPRDDGLQVSVGVNYATGYGFEVQQSVTSPTSGFVTIRSLGIFDKSVFLNIGAIARIRYFRVRAISPRMAEVSTWSNVVKVAVAGGENLSGGGGNATGLIGPGVPFR